MSALPCTYILRSTLEVLSVVPIIPVTLVVAFLDITGDYEDLPSSIVPLWFMLWPWFVPVCGIVLGDEAFPVEVEADLGKVRTGSNSRASPNGSLSVITRPPSPRIGGA